VNGLSAAGLLAQDGQLFLGEDFLPWMVLAFGAAMVVGNLVALVRPPAADPKQPARADDQERPAYGRAAVMIVIGLVAAAWGAASLLA
jgi:hypothetical protein